MQRNRIITAALVAGLTIVAASAGYVTAQVTAYSSGKYGSQYRNSAAGSGGPMSPMRGAPSQGPGGGSGFSDPTLAHFIAEKAGTRLAGKAPQDVPASQVRALSEQVPAGATVDRRSGRITFTGTAVSFTVVAIAPGAPDMTFSVAGISNPAIIVPRGARVTVRFVNNDSNEAHGWLITDNQPPFGFGEPATPAIAGASAGVIGNPTSAGDGANTISFTAGSTGNYQYICPMPGHAQMGMHGAFIVR
jgi:rusticyanin